MKILIAHSRYRYPGGEETVFEQEITLLQGAGHEVIVYDRSNLETAAYPPWKKITVPFQIIWFEKARQELRNLIGANQPDIVHFHNTHFMISPAGYYACREMGVPVVQALDNPRLMCPASTFFREGHLCIDCLGKSLAWPGILHGCYRHSRLQTGAVATMVSYHRWRHTWDSVVDTYLVSTEFYRQKFIEGGLPIEKLALKPLFVTPDPQPRRAGPGGYALYAGRLGREKGIPVLLEAWKNLAIPLKIRGDGNLLGDVQQAAHSLPQIELVGRLSRPELFDLFKGARFLVWPSQGYYETFGMVAIEAYACGVPVLGSRTGVAEEIILDQQTGLHFDPENPGDLAAKAQWAWDHPENMARMGQRARQEFEAKYSAQQNYARLMDIYQQTIEKYRAAH